MPKPEVKAHIFQSCSLTVGSQVSHITAGFTFDIIQKTIDWYYETFEVLYNYAEEHLHNVKSQHVSAD